MNKKYITEKKDWIERVYYDIALYWWLKINLKIYYLKWIIRKVYWSQIQEYSYDYYNL